MKQLFPRVVLSIQCQNRMKRVTAKSLMGDIELVAESFTRIPHCQRCLYCFYRVHSSSDNPKILFTGLQKID